MVVRCESKRDESFLCPALSPFFSLSLTLDATKLRILRGRASRPKQWSALDSESSFTPEFSTKRHETRLCFRRKSRPTFVGRLRAFNQDYVFLVSNSYVKKKESFQAGERFNLSCESRSERISNNFLFARRRVENWLNL